MSNNMPPLIRLEVEEMKYSVVHFLHQQHLEIESNVEKQIEQAIATYDFQARVEKDVHDAISEAIKQYFTWGNGATVVGEAVTETLNKLFNNPHDAEKEG